MITKQTTITTADYAEFCKVVVQQLGRPLNTSKVSVMLRFFTGVCIGILAMVFFKFNPKLLQSFHSPTAILVATPFLVFLGAIWLNSYKIRTAAIADPENITLGLKTYEFGDQGITETWQHGNSFVRWSAVNYCHTHKDNLYVFIDKTRAFILPKNTFTDDADRDRVVNWIDQHIT